MAKLEPMHLAAEGCEQFKDEDGVILSRHAASDDVVAMVLAQDTESNDGRSNWLWVRLINGDLMLATYPQGETYIACEKDAQYPH